MTLRVSCGGLERPARKGPEGEVMDINEAFALLAELELHEVEELDRDWFEAELRELLPPA